MRKEAIAIAIFDFIIGTVIGYLGCKDGNLLVYFLGIFFLFLSTVVSSSLFYTKGRKYEKDKSNYIEKKDDFGNVYYVKEEKK